MPLVSIARSLYTAILTITERKVHRIPVIDPVTKDFLFLITHKRILKFLYLFVRDLFHDIFSPTNARSPSRQIYDLPQPHFIHQTLEELKLGTFNKLLVVSESHLPRLTRFPSAQIDLQTKLIDVLRIFQTNRISALPVVDSQRRLCDIYSKFDIMVHVSLSLRCGDRHSSPA